MKINCEHEIIPERIAVSLHVRVKIATLFTPRNTIPVVTFYATKQLDRFANFYRRGSWNNTQRNVVNTFATKAEILSMRELLSNFGGKKIGQFLSDDLHEKMHHRTRWVSKNRSKTVTNR